MAGIGIIRAPEYSNKCAGRGCFTAMRDGIGQSEECDTSEIVGFDTCCSCGRNKADKILARALRLEERGAEATHLSNCLVGACPFKSIYLDTLDEDVKLPVVERSHP